MIYTVIVVSLDMSKKPDKRLKTFRTWGYYLKKEEAIEAIKENYTDIFEMGYYTHAVLNSMPEGLARSPESQEWFEAIYEDRHKDPEVKSLDYDPLNKDRVGGRSLIVW